MSSWRPWRHGGEPDELTPHAERGVAQPRREYAGEGEQQVARQRRFLVAELYEVFVLQAQHLAVGLGPHVGRARLAVEERLLAHHAAGRDLGERSDADTVHLRDTHLERAGNHEMHRAI